MANGANEKTSLLTDAANRQPSVNANEKGWGFSDRFIPNVLLFFLLIFHSYIQIITTHFEFMESNRSHV